MPRRWRRFFTALGKTPVKPRFFLLQFMSVFGHSTLDSISYKSIGDKLSFSEGFVTDSIEYLSKNGLLNKTKNKSGKEGKPLNYFSIDERLLGQIALQNESGDAAIRNMFNESSHSEIISRLLFISADGSRGHNLKPLNVMLLISLLVNANKNGVVYRLGRSDLRSITGMAPDQLKSQLSNLMSKGYIYKAVSGFKGVRLFGLINSKYFLNITHESFHINNRMNAIETLMLEENFSLSEAAVIFNQVGRLKRNPEAYDFSDLLDRAKSYFKYDRKKLVVDYLQMKIEEYSSYILSYQLGLEGNKKNERITHIKLSDKAYSLLSRKVINDVIPNNFKNKYDDEFPSKDEKEALIALIIGVSLKLAEQISRCSSFYEYAFDGNKRYFFLITSAPNHQLEFRIRSDVQQSHII